MPDQAHITPPTSPPDESHEGRNGGIQPPVAGFIPSTREEAPAMTTTYDEPEYSALYDPPTAHHHALIRYYELPARQGSQLLTLYGPPAPKGEAARAAGYRTGNPPMETVSCSMRCMESGRFHYHIETDGRRRRRFKDPYDAITYYAQTTRLDNKARVVTYCTIAGCTIGI